MNGNEPAYPCATDRHKGLTKLEYATVHIAQSLIATREADGRNIPYLVNEARSIANALFAEVGE